ncbi:MAG TPA: hypothetical protein VF601_23865 [Beijerinckiaceae bacterium]
MPRLFAVLLLCALAPAAAADDEEELLLRPPLIVRDCKAGAVEERLDCLDRLTQAQGREIRALRRMLKELTAPGFKLLAQTPHTPEAAPAR